MFSFRLAEKIDSSRSHTDIELFAVSFLYAVTYQHYTRIRLIFFYRIKQFYLLLERDNEINKKSQKKKIGPMDCLN